MPEKNRDPHIVALESVYSALKDLDLPGRKKVLSSVFALLGVEELAQAVVPQSGSHPQAFATQSPAPTEALATRPVSIVELIQEKKPGTSAQRIALFAYYREKYEGIARFKRDDLKSYFAKAKEAPATNFDRDFVEAVRKGWIHEEGSDSYVTSKGVEVVESDFKGERKYSKGTKPRRIETKKKRGVTKR
jgi:hypothetical protein